MDSFTMIAVFILGFATMFFGAIGGGVGLVVRPVLLFLGYAPAAVIASPRIAAIPGELPSLLLLYKNKRIDGKITLFLIIPQLLGSVLAAFAVVSIFRGWLDVLLGILLLVAGILLLLNQRFGLQEREVRISLLRHAIAFFGTIAISFFSTITGGLGPLFTSLYMAVYGKSYISASAMWRVAGYIGNLFAAAIFVMEGLIDWSLALTLGAGFMVGSYFGTKYALKKGERWVRGIVIIIVFASAVKLLFF